LLTFIIQMIDFHQADLVHTWQVTSHSSCL
jgi:hypothetical protein